jgi:hypothetical protein
MVLAVGQPVERHCNLGRTFVIVPRREVQGVVSLRVGWLPMIQPHRRPTSGALCANRPAGGRHLAVGFAARDPGFLAFR